MRLNCAEEKYLVSGKIFPENLGVVKIYNANFSLETSLNEDGEFDFPPIEREIFNLPIVLDGETIEVKNISVN